MQPRKCAVIIYENVYFNSGGFLRAFINTLALKYYIYEEVNFLLQYYAF